MFGIISGGVGSTKPQCHVTLWKVKQVNEAVNSSLYSVGNYLANWFIVCLFTDVQVVADVAGRLL